jgi:hypothetical protein
MSKHGAAQKVQTNFPSMRISEVATAEATAKVINFKSSAIDTPSEEVQAEATAEHETVSIYEVIEKVNAEYNNGERVLPSELERRADEEAARQAEEERQAAPTPEPIAEPKPVQSIEEIKRKSEVLSRLSVKWDSLNEKRRRVEDFAISHDGDTASVRVRDAQGELFESNSPKTIGKLIEFWKEEFSDAIAGVEKEMREIA